MHSSDRRCHGLQHRTYNDGGGDADGGASGFLLVGSIVNAINSTVSTTNTPNSEGINQMSSITIDKHTPMEQE